MNSLQTTEHQLISNIANIITAARQQVRQTVNIAMVQSYWEIGRLIVEDEQQGEQRAQYGKHLLQEISQRLTDMFGKGFDVTNLRNMRLFYLVFPIRDAVRRELSWTHYRSLIRIENPQARQWYLRESIENNWSARALDRQISVLYYERLLASQNKAVVAQEAEKKTEPLKETIQDYLRDPYILDFLNLQDKTYQENQIEQAIISNLQDFYIDLVFYNFKLKCFLLIDLKIGKLKHQDIGQMDTYVRLYDEQFKGEDDNPAIGLVLCSEQSEAVAKYSVLADRKQIFSSKYVAYLPTEQELERQLTTSVLQVREAAAVYKAKY
ncbi:Predicted nuclease of restriction endonuclease-like (RecB) superfamily, DUF1016 family [Pasteurella testudinis DSM 23072]|uniref:Predicted nuclease of restriction endonuclease-like (RecB) superfamily, DUF1016 family n=1 Tax=Pasteurella testudinis DSM 23072 TaxID=1122938 RepID=A0A1W1UQT5_9PAST|nr:PDDEXK nuclease domain-containing protein [Pasteurella testudinis]SMB83485.1 Predicted nuclease of restriction endonuclease-like (RecB) superfamily, DUF1016 family [Pasteurella testudinis DSM 23072]SUB51075.1 Uncharacterized conserved protein [Pasteurella testudinis]